MRVLTVFVAFFLLAPLSHARGKGGGHHGRGMHRMLEKLDLTKDQQAKLKDLRGKNKSEMKSLHEKKRAIHEKVQAAMGSDTSEGELRKLHNEAQEIQKKMADLRFEQILAIRKVLTPEQRKKFAELHKGKKGRRGKGMRHRGMDDEDDDE